MIDYVIKDVMEVAGYLPIGIICGIAAVILYLVCFIWSGRDSHAADCQPSQSQCSVTGSARQHIWNVVVWFLLVVYMVVMFITVFLSREPGSRQGIDLTLFSTWGVTSQEHAFVIENILLFVPFGILFPAAVGGISRRHLKDRDSSMTDNKDSVRVNKLHRLTVPLGFLISVGIETVQLITERGYCQLDDVVMNTLGALVGYVVFASLKFMIKKK